MEKNFALTFESAHGRVAVKEVEEYSVANGGIFNGERIVRFVGSLLGSEKTEVYLARLDDLIITPVAA